MTHWYVLQTKPKKEAVVQAQLARADYELFFPQMRGVRAPVPLFPSYLFIRTNFADPHTHRLIRYTRGVTRILGDTAGPRPIAETVVRTLMAQTRDGSLIEQTLLLRPGDTVRMKRGILRDLAGIIERHMPEAGRVRVLFQWLRASMRAVVRYTDLEKVAA